MTTIIIIYAVGVLLNALMAASVYDDLVEDNRLERVRLVAVTLAVMASFMTWAYMICYLLVKLIIYIFRKPKKNGRKDEKAS